MRLARFTAAAAVLATLFGASVAQAGGQFQVQQAQPTRIVPIMECRLQTFDNAWGIYIINGANVNYTLPQGTQIAWVLSNGARGTFTIGAGGMPAGTGLLVDLSPTYENCNASVL